MKLGTPEILLGVAVVGAAWFFNMLCPISPALCNRIFPVPTDKLLQGIEYPNSPVGARRHDRGYSDDGYGDE